MRGREAVTISDRTSAYYGREGHLVQTTKENLDNWNLRMRDSSIRIVQFPGEFRTQHVFRSWQLTAASDKD